MARGFWAEMQHQMKVAAREAERRQRAAAREQQASLRRAEQSRKAAERASAQAARSAEADRRRMEKEAKAAHVDAMLAEVELLNADLESTYADIDGLLEATLSVDDYVDLESLRRTVDHPAFDRADLMAPAPPPPPVPDPVMPVYTPPPQPGGVFGRKKKFADATADAQAAFEAARAAWQVATAQVGQERQRLADERARLESQRQATLAQEQARYQAECAARAAEVAEHNRSLDLLIANLGYGAVDAVQEYVSIVLGNSAYPEHFEVDYNFLFDPTSAELTLKVLVPGPEAVPSIKAYRYIRASDEITATALSLKAQKDRYNGAVHQVALRTLHEIFEADRRGLIRSISLEVGADVIDPATGHPTAILFVAVAAERDAFLAIDLAAVVPAATLTHLGAAVSKNPHGLVAADGTGIRRS